MTTPDGKSVPGKHHITGLFKKKGNAWKFFRGRPYVFQTPPPAPAPAGTAPAKK
jgi:hypothetical protein